MKEIRELTVLDQEKKMEANGMEARRRGNIDVRQR